MLPCKERSTGMTVFKNIKNISKLYTFSDHSFYETVLLLFSLSLSLSLNQ